jgi:glycosyltransferase involved in cell wall biosynthesis
MGSKVLSRMWERGLGPSPRDADVVHATTLLVPPKRRAALVVTIHDVVPWTYPETLTTRGLGFHRRMGARAAREADLIVTPTFAVADQIRAILSPRADVIAVHPGFSAALNVPENAGERRARHVRADDYLLFVGTAEPRKGLDTLLDALAEPALKEQTHLVVMPSRAEGFGLPVLEAMALGVPVVTSDDPAMSEVGGGATQIFPVGDSTALSAAIARVLNDFALRAQMIEAGPSARQGLRLAELGENYVEPLRPARSIAAFPGR